MLLSDSFNSHLCSPVWKGGWELRGSHKACPLYLVPICPGGIRALSPLTAFKEALGTKLCPQGAAESPSHFGSTFSEVALIPLPEIHPLGCIFWTWSWFQAADLLAGTHGGFGSGEMVSQKLSLNLVTQLFISSERFQPWVGSSGGTFRRISWWCCTSLNFQLWLAKTTTLPSSFLPAPGWKAKPKWPLLSLSCCRWALVQAAPDVPGGELAVLPAPARGAPGRESRLRALEQRVLPALLGGAAGPR